MTGLAAANGNDGSGEDGGGSGGGGGDGAVAVSLIDALQRWADALEAQIDIMKSEVEGVRAENKELTRQARTDARLMEGDLWGPIFQYKSYYGARFTSSNNLFSKTSFSSSGEVF